MVTDLQERVLNRFTRFALTVAPTRDHRAFRDDLEGWYAEMTDQDRATFSRRFMHTKREAVAEIARPMYQLFLKKSGTTPEVEESRG